MKILALATRLNFCSLIAVCGVTPLIAPVAVAADAQQSPKYEELANQFKCAPKAVQDYYYYKITLLLDYISTQLSQGKRMADLTADYCCQSTLSTLQIPASLVQALPADYLRIHSFYAEQALDISPLYKAQSTKNDENLKHIVMRSKKEVLSSLPANSALTLNEGIESQFLNIVPHLLSTETNVRLAQSLHIKNLDTDAQFGAAFGFYACEFHKLIPKAERDTLLLSSKSATSTTSTIDKNDVLEGELSYHNFNLAQKQCCLYYCANMMDIQASLLREHTSDDAAIDKINRENSFRFAAMSFKSIPSHATSRLNQDEQDVLKVIIKSMESIADKQNDIDAAYQQFTRECSAGLKGKMPACMFFIYLLNNAEALNSIIHDSMNFDAIIAAAIKKNPERFPADDTLFTLAYMRLFSDEARKYASQLK